MGSGVLRCPVCWWVELCPTWLVAWPEESQHLWMGGGGSWLLTLMTLEGVFQNGACQHQCPHGRTGSPKWLPPVSLPQCELQLPPASLGDSPRSGRGSDPGSLLPSSLVPTTDKILCLPFQNGVSINHSLLSLLKISITDLQSQMLWGLIFLVHDSGVQSPLWGTDPLFPGGEPLKL